jgi:hypothetical protein
MGDHENRRRLLPWRAGGGEYHDELDELGRSYATGKDPGAVLDAIRFCFVCRIDVPEWARRAFLDIHARGKTGEFKSWDEGWGRPLTKGQFERFNRDLVAWFQVREKIEARPAGEPIDDELFEKIGRDLGIGGKSTVKRIYAAPAPFPKRGPARPTRK